jgi:hypothetical protein
MIFRVRVYSDHALVGKDTYIKPLSKLGARLLEMEEEPEKKAKKVKKTRKARTKKATEDTIPDLTIFAL